MMLVVKGEVVLYSICEACIDGDHRRHTPVIQAPPEGKLGGTGCNCQGECVDGRYYTHYLVGLLKDDTVPKGLRKSTTVVLRDLNKKAAKRAAE